MKKQYNLEADSLRVLSGFYRNDMGLFSRYVNDRFLFDIPDSEAGEQTALSIRDILPSLDPGIRYGIRQATPSVFSKCDPVCSILINYTLDIYRNELPDSQKNLQLLISWVNLKDEEGQPDWRITLFHISAPGTGAEQESSCSLPVSDLQRDAFVKEAQPAYSSLRSNLIRIKDKNHTLHFLEKDDIIWAESNHLQSIIHTHAGTIQTNATLTQLANGTLSCLYRPHISYLINPRYVYKINQRRMLMTDGTIIPIPERRLAQVKKDLCHVY